jgi:signal transduction histidine kinase
VRDIALASLARLLRTASFRLAAAYAGLFAISTAALFLIVYWITGTALVSQLRTGIEADSEALVGEFRAGGQAQLAHAIDRRTAGRSTGVHFIFLGDAQGKFVAGNFTPAKVATGWLDLSVERPDLIDEDGDRDTPQLIAFGRTLSPELMLVVGEDSHHVVEAQEALLHAFAWAGSVVVLLALLGGATLSGTWLRRIDAINRASRKIVAGAFSQRLPISGTNDELDQLGVTLNEMLARIESLMENLQQVSTDIAHDLRTPLSRLRQRLEGARLEARTLSECQQSIGEAIEDTDSILAIFAALLRIAQIESGTLRSGFARVDLSALAQNVADIYGPVAEDAGQTLQARVESNIAVPGDRDLLMQLTVNLLENAIRHAGTGARIELEVREHEGVPMLIVSDNGPGIPAAERDVVFRRFHRTEIARSTPGNGLGLALVKAIAELHHIAIRLEDNKPGLRVALRFNAAGGASPP